MYLPVEFLIGDGAAKILDFMWFLIDRGVDATSLPAKISLLPPPEEITFNNANNLNKLRELLRNYLVASKPCN